MASKSRLNTAWSSLLSRHPHLSALVDDLRPWLPPLNFVTLHYIYFILVSLVFSVVFWISSDVEDREDVSYVDSLFLVVSAVTNTGLNTVDLSALTGGQQGMLWVLMTLGSAMWVSFWTVLVRRHKRVERMRLARIRKGLDGGGGFALADLRGAGSGGGGGGYGRRRERGSSGATTLSSVVDVPPMILRKIMSKEPKEKVDEEPDVGADGLASAVGSGVSLADTHGSLTATLHHSASTGEDKSHHHHHHPSPFDNPSDDLRRQHDDLSPRSSSSPRAWFSWRKLFPAKKDKQDGDRDPASQLLLLESSASSESERLAQRDHQALNLLALIIPLYAVLWVLVSALILGAWISRHYASAVEEYGGYGVGAWWAGFFYAGSAFNNCGMSLLDANLVPFQHSFLVLFLLASLILAGNTAFPAFLRLMIWCMLEGLKLLTPERLFVAEKATLLYILKYPRQVYTHLFPARQTWLLVGMLVATMTIDWVAFEVLSIGNPAVERIPVGPRILDGLFQAISVRGTGFYVVPVSELYTSLQVLYMVMMYISAYPIVIAMRHSNVSEERSGALAIHAKFDALPSSSSSSSSATSDDPELGHLLPSTTGSQPLEPPTPTTHSHPLQTALRRFASFLSPRRNKDRSHHHHHQPPSRPSILGQKIRRQLLHDLWVLSLATLLITLLEIYGSHASDSDPMDHGEYHRPPVNPFHVAFEVVSAYGCVGMSVGLERASVSLAGGWAVASRLVLVGVMLKGRHRGLWVVLDRVTGVGGDGGDEGEDEDEGFEGS